MTRESDKNGKQKALELACSQIEKQFGKGSIMRLGDNPVLPGIDRISTGSIRRWLQLTFGARTRL